MLERHPTGSGSSRWPRTAMRRARARRSRGTGRSSRCWSMNRAAEPERGTRVAPGREALLEAATHPRRRRGDQRGRRRGGARGDAGRAARRASGSRSRTRSRSSRRAAGARGALREGGGELVPVDSEHSAILQCLRGRATGEVRRLVLTASGGPFRSWTRRRSRARRPSRRCGTRPGKWAPRSPSTSATLANKALEVIEAHFLFGAAVRPDRGRRPSAVDHPLAWSSSWTDRCWRRWGSRPWSCRSSTR